MSELLYQTLRESVVNAIRTKIMNHQIRPGERIVELELAQEFQTSRGPIREALRQLENWKVLIPEPFPAVPGSLLSFRLVICW